VAAAIAAPGRRLDSVGRESEENGATVARLLRQLRLVVAREDGQDVVEYALLAAFVALIAAAVLVQISDELATIFNQILGYLQAA